MNQTTLDAKSLLEDLSLYQLPVDPLVVCKKLDIEYDETPYEGIDGTLIVCGNKHLIGVNSTISEPGRKAFTCAHEIGHAHYDVQSGQASFSCTRNDVGYGKTPDADIELRANEFASELLLPRDLFLKEINKQQPSWETLKTLSNKLGTSLQATTNRFVTLSAHTCWLVVVKDGIIQRYSKALHNEFKPQVNKKFKPPKSDPGKFQDVSAEFWLHSSRSTKNKSIKYWPLPINRYGECPVLLWDSSNSLLNGYSFDNFDDDRSRRDDDNGRSRW